MEKMVEVERATQEELRQDPMYALKLDLIARLELVGILYEYSPNPRSTTSPRITGSIYARRTWSRARSLRYGSGRRRRSDSSGSRALRR